MLKLTISGVAIPSNWGLLSYCILEEKFTRSLVVAIPSNWGLLSYTPKNVEKKEKNPSQSLLIEVFFPTLLLNQKRKKVKEVAIPSNWGLLSYSVRLPKNGRRKMSQSLLIEVFFPTASFKVISESDGTSQSLLIEVFFPTSQNRGEGEKGEKSRNPF